MNNRIRVILVVLAAALLIFACKKTDPGGDAKPWQEGESGEETSAPEDEEELAKQAKLEAIDPLAYGEIDGLDVEPGTYFSIIGKNNHTQYWMAVKHGAQAAIEDLNEALGFEGADKLKFVYSAPSATDQVTEQVNILDEELARYPSAVGIAMIDSKSCLVQFDLAAENGIPIITFDSASTYQNTMANISTNNKKAAKEAAKHMADALSDKGKVLVFSYDSKSITSHERVDSFVKEMKKNHPDITLTEVYYLDQFEKIKKKMANPEEKNEEDVEAEAEDETIEETEETEPAGETISETAEAAEESQPEAIDISRITEEDVYEYIFEQNPDIDGIYATNGATVVKMVELCEEHEREGVVIMGYDADDEEIAVLKEGKIAGLIAQNPYGMGYATIIAEARTILELGNEAEVDTGYLWITPDNVEDIEVQRMLY